MLTFRLEFIAALFGLLSLSTQVGAKELKLAHFVSPQHPYHVVFEQMRDEIAKRTNGEVTIRIFPGGELGSNPADQINRVIDGVADMAFFMPGYTPAQFPRTLVMELPGVLTNPKDGLAGYVRATELTAADYRRVKLLANWVNSTSVLFTRKPVRQLSDVKGMKIRVASPQIADLVQAWGATAVFLPVTELYTGIQTGVVDGAIIDPGAALAFRLSEVSNYMTTGWEANVGTFGLVMNKDVYDGLSASGKKAIDELAGPALAVRAYDAWDVLTLKALQSFQDLPGHEVIKLSGPAAAEFNGLSRKIREAEIAKLEAKSIPGKQLLATMQGPR